jgi:hypothetical protein
MFQSLPSTDLLALVIGAWETTGRESRLNFMQDATTVLERSHPGGGKVQPEYRCVLKIHSLCSDPPVGTGLPNPDR